MVQLNRIEEISHSDGLTFRFRSLALALMHRGADACSLVASVDRVLKKASWSFAPGAFGGLCA